MAAINRSPIELGGVGLVSLNDVRLLLGHASIQTTQRYQHFESSDISPKVVAILNRQNVGTSNHGVAGRSLLWTTKRQDFIWSAVQSLCAVFLPPFTAAVSIRACGELAAEEIRISQNKVDQYMRWLDDFKRKKN